MDKQQTISMTTTTLAVLILVALCAQCASAIDAADDAKQSMGLTVRTSNLERATTEPQLRRCNGRNRRSQRRRAVPVGGFEAGKLTPTSLYWNE